jgi:hypothetical protein
MKIYVAGSFVDQKRLRAEASKLWDLGHEITGTWLNEIPRNQHISEQEHRKKVALKDLVELAKADMVILDNRISSGGKNTEWGAALFEFHNKLLWLVGEESTVFHALADRRFDTWEQAIIALS